MFLNLFTYLFTYIRQFVTKLLNTIHFEN